MINKERFKPIQLGRTLWVLRDNLDRAPKGAGVFKSRAEALEWLDAND